MPLMGVIKDKNKAVKSRQTRTQILIKPIYSSLVLSSSKMLEEAL